VQVKKQAIENKRAPTTPAGIKKNAEPAKTEIKEQEKETSGQQTNTPKYIYQGNSN
jgi:hypothetical protein